MVKQSDLKRRLTVLRKMHIIFGAVALAAIFSLGAIAQTRECGCGQQGGAIGNGICANLDLTKQVALEGKVVGLHMGRGMGFSSFTLQTGNGPVTVVASPYRILLDANYTIKEGDQMSVVAYSSTNNADTYAAAALKNLTSGKEITLRNDSGMPAVGGMRGMGGMRGIGMGGNCPMRNAIN
jgi:hypothetical protein